ncbi:MAG: type II CAAX endopeptidase family protein [Oscillospiraceae bacterium]|nr:type II CAAX endopeptidase family protein [Oscillospiraceae bacterium]
MDTSKKLPNLLLAGRFLLQYALITLAVLIPIYMAYGILQPHFDPYRVYYDLCPLIVSLIANSLFLWQYITKTPYQARLHAAFRMQGKVLWVIAAFVMGVLYSMTKYAVTCNLQPDAVINFTVWSSYDSVLDFLKAQLQLPVLVTGLASNLIAPITEEIICRFHLPLHLSKSFSPLWIAVISSTIFALFHLEMHLAALLWHFIGGLFFYLICRKSGTLLCPIAAHMGTNLYISLLYEINLNWVVTGLPFTFIVCCAMIGVTVWILLQKDPLAALTHCTEVTCK